MKYAPVDLVYSLNIRHLYGFLSVSKSGNILKTAQDIGLTQPALSIAIKNLEKNIGINLFERNSQGLILTNAGKLFAIRVEMALEHLKTAQNEFNTIINQNNIRQNFLNILTNQHLKCFLYFAQNLSFSAASYKLGIKQPNLHRTISEINSIISQKLYEKIGANFVLTKFGIILARRIGLYYKELEMGLEEIDEYSGNFNSSLNIGALPLARAKWIPNSITQILEKYPKISIRIIDGPYDEQLNALLNGKIDFIFGALRPKNISNEIEQIELFADPLVIVMRSNHPYAVNFDSNKDKLSNEQLASLKWIVAKKFTPMRNQFEDFMNFKGLEPPNQVIECASLIAIRQILLQSNVAALLSPRQIKDEIKNGELKIMGPPLTNTSRPFGISYRKGFKPTKISSEFLEIAKLNAKYL